MANEFTEMGMALDKAVQSREPETSGGTGESENQSQEQSTQTVTDTGNPQAGGREVEGGVGGNRTVQPTAKGSNENQRAINYRNASRRLDRKHDNGRNNALAQRVNQLAQEVEQLRNSNDEGAQNLAEQKAEHLQDLLSLQASQRYQDWSDKAYDNFGDDAENFLNLSEKWGQYVNSNEPELAKMIHRQYGQQLYYAWLERMENPATRKQWVEMTRYERSRVLSDFYKKIDDHFKGLDAQPQGQPQGTPQGNTQPQGQPQGQPQVTDIPIPGGGRNTSTLPPTNNFGLALQQAMNRRGVSERNM